jgi:hypothetical protein
LNGAVRRLVVLVTAVLVVAGCGSEDKSSGSGDVQTVEQLPVTAGLPPEAKDALRPSLTGFPAAKGKSLQQVANGVQPGLQVGLGAKTFVPGRTARVPFGLVDGQQTPVFGATALYVSRGPNQPARGPYVAPGDSLVVQKKFKGKISDRNDLKLVYAARVPFPKAGRYALLAVTRSGGKLVGGASSLTVPRSSKIPDVGDPAPRVATDTKATQPDPKLLDTRIPPDDMHATSFKDVVGKKPVALLFSTPQYCQSRVCGPVTDILLQLEQKYRGRLTFIHQEVYAKNKPPALRPPLKAFALETEPWLFVVGRNGKVAARLEGIFGLKATEAALKAGLR